MSEVCQPDCKLLSGPSIIADPCSLPLRSRQPEVDFDPYLPSFNLSPAAFPWSAAKVADVAEARKVMSGLFFDELLGMASVGAFCCMTSMRH